MRRPARQALGFVLCLVAGVAPWLSPRVEAQAGSGPATAAREEAEHPREAAAAWTAAQQALFDGLVADWLDARAALDPEWASAVGLHRHDDLLTLPDDATVTRLHDLAQHTLRALDAGFDLDGLRAWPPALETDLRLFRSKLELELHEDARRDAREVQPGMPLGAVSSVHQLLIGDFAPAAVRVHDAIARLAQLPAVVRIARGRLRSPPELWTRMAMDDTDGALAFLDEVAVLAAPVADADPAVRRELQDALAAARASLSGYRTWLEQELLPRSHGEYAIGRAEFDWRLRHVFFTDLDADGLLALGWREFQATLSMLDATARSIDPSRGWRQQLEGLMAEHPPADRLIETYREEAARARAFLVEHDLVTIPEESLQIVETPGFLRTTVPFAAYDSPAPLDQSRLGTFYVTPIPEAHYLSDIPGTTWHEAYPGHHLQLVVSKDNPSLVRRLNNSPLLSEGWGFYCEELAHETGYYDDPKERLMQLNWRLQRAARVILDTSIHAFGMSHAEAVAFLEHEVGMGEGTAVASANAYTAEPTYFSSYLLGMLEIVRIREDLRARLGPRFSLREFHDRLLRGGNVPPALLGREIAADWR